MRLGLHFNNAGDVGRAKWYIDQVKPPMCKFLLGSFDQELLDYARERGALLVLRVYTDDQSAQNADAYINQVVAEAVKWHFDAVEGYNEAFQNGSGDLTWRAAFDIKLMQRADACGIKAVIGSFSTGNPGNISDYQYYLPALKYASDHGHYVGLHEYSAPVMQWGAGNNQWYDGNWRLDDQAANTGVLGWWTLRYRRAVMEWRRLGLVTIPKILITEGGLDDIQPRPPSPGRGWKDHKSWWTWNNFGDYAAQWAWYCRQLTHDSYIAGVCDFGWGALDPAWSTFRLDTEPDMLKRLITEMQVIPRLHDDAVTEPVPVVCDFLSALRTVFPGALDLRSSLAKSVSAQYEQRRLTEIEVMALHHTGSPVTTTWESVARYHVANNGWPGIGYHVGVGRDGQVSLLNDPETVSYHVGNQNRRALGICVPGDYRTDQPTKDMLEVLPKLVDIVRDYLGRADMPIDGHRGVSGGTVCPGGNLEELLPMLNDIRGGDEVGTSDVAVYDTGGVKRDSPWLLSKYGRVEIKESSQKHRYKLVRIEETVGPAILKVRVLDKSGAPASVMVVETYPDLGAPSGDLQDLTRGDKALDQWSNRGVPQFTDGSGYTGFGLGADSWIKSFSVGGPYHVWLFHTAIGSDCISWLGWLGGTDHMGPMSLVFQEVEDTGSVTPPPPSGGDETDLTEIESILAEVRDLLKALTKHLGVA